MPDDTPTHFAEDVIDDSKTFEYSPADVEETATQSPPAEMPPSATDDTVSSNLLVHNRRPTGLSFTKNVCVIFIEFVLPITCTPPN